MASSLLRILAARNLPMVVEGGDLVDAVHILVLGGHVEARMEKAVRTADHETPWSGRRAVTIAVGVDSDAAVEAELTRLLA